MAAFAVLGLVWSTAVYSMLYLGTSVSVSACVCTVPGGVYPAAACASPGRICSTAACAVPEDGLQQLAPGLFTRASAAPRHVCLQELLSAPEVYVDFIL
jgi:hypothetical protein